MNLTKVLLRGRGFGGGGGRRGGGGGGLFGGRGGRPSPSPRQAPPPRSAPPPRAAAPPPRTSPGAQPRAPGLMGQMAATAGGVAIGSVVGHGISNVSLVIL